MDMTIDELWREYSTTPIFQRRKDDYVHEDCRRYKLDIKPAIGTKKVREITREDASKLTKKIAHRSPRMGNMIHEMLNRMFDHAFIEEKIIINPMYHLPKPAKLKPRERILADYEIKLLWEVTDNSELAIFTKLCLLTGQRVGSIMDMKWKNIDINIWYQEKNKAGKPFLCPLNPLSLELLGMIPVSNDYFFTNLTNKLYNYRQKIKKLSGMDNFTHHDLRRTARTLLARVGVNHYIGELCLDHKREKTDITYNLYDSLKEKTKAINLLGDEIDKIVAK